MNEFDNEAPSMLARDSSYSEGSENFDAWLMLHTYATYVIEHFEILEKKRSHRSLIPSSLAPSNLFIGEQLLIYVHPEKFNVFNNFWLVSN